MKMKLVIFDIEGLFSREEWEVKAALTEEKIREEIAAEWKVDPERVKITAIFED